MSNALSEVGKKRAEFSTWKMPLQRSLMTTLRPPIGKFAPTSYTQPPDLTSTPNCRTLLDMETVVRTGAGSAGRGFGSNSSLQVLPNWLVLRGRGRVRRCFKQVWTTKYLETPHHRMSRQSRGRFHNTPHLQATCELLYSQFCAIATEQRSQLAAHLDVTHCFSRLLHQSLDGERHASQHSHTSEKHLNSTTNWRALQQRAKIYELLLSWTLKPHQSSWNFYNSEYCSSLYRKMWYKMQDRNCFGNFPNWPNHPSTS